MKYEVELAITRISNCSFRRLDYTWYVSPYYTTQYYINTWSGYWRSYDNRWNWPMYNGPIIRPDPTKINKGRRKKIRISMVMDKIEGRINMLPTRGWARSSRAWFKLSVCLCFLLLYLLEQLNFNCCYNISIYLTLF
jgi:hypothetical protein